MSGNRVLRRNREGTVLIPTGWATTSSVSGIKMPSSKSRKRKKRATDEQKLATLSGFRGHPPASVGVVPGGGMMSMLIRKTHSKSRPTPSTRRAAFFKVGGVSSSSDRQHRATTARATGLRDPDGRTVTPTPGASLRSHSSRATFHLSAIRSTRLCGVTPQFQAMMTFSQFGQAF